MSSKKMAHHTFNRRSFIKSSLITGVALTLPTTGAFAQSQPIVTFGLIADTHVSDKPDDKDTVSEKAGWDEYSTGSLRKIEDFAQRMNNQSVDFVTMLGDFICNPKDKKAPYEERRKRSLAFLEQAEERLARFEGPRYHVFGNHDTDQLSKEDVMKKTVNTNIQTGKTYYSFDQNGIHFLVLDANFKTDGSPFSGRPGAAGNGYTWADAYIPEKQLSWIQEDLEQTTLPTIVFTHQLLNPLKDVDPDFEVELTVQNGDAVRTLFEKSGRVLAVFAGHYHSGGYQFLHGIHYVTLQGNVAFGNDVATHNQYDTVRIYQNDKGYTLAISGQGRCKSFSLASFVS